MAILVAYAGKHGATKRLMCGPWPIRALAAAIVMFWGEAITARYVPRGGRRQTEARWRHGPGTESRTPAGRSRPRRTAW
jgi:hypothetical protein